MVLLQWSEPFKRDYKKLPEEIKERGVFSMGWTKWRKLAEGNKWNDDIFDWDGPACYELALAGPRGGNLKIMYVGETANEKRRMAQYAAFGSHLKKECDKALRDGWSLWYRAHAFDTKEQAKSLQDKLLLQYDYPWNILKNT